MSYQQVLIRKALEGEQVRRFMKTDPVTVPPSASVRQLVEDYIYKYHFKMFPVTEDSDKLIGCVTTKQLDGVPAGRVELQNGERAGDAVLAGKYDRTSGRRDEGPLPHGPNGVRPSHRHRREPDGRRHHAEGHVEISFA